MTHPQQSTNLYIRRSSMTSHHHHIITYYLQRAAQARLAGDPNTRALEGYYLGLAFLLADFTGG